MSKKRRTPEERAEQHERLRTSGEEARANMQEILDRIGQRLDAYREHEERRERRRARIRRLFSFRRAA
jgi:hypothetical protein